MVGRGPGVGARAALWLLAWLAAACSADAPGADRASGRAGGPGGPGGQGGRRVVTLAPGDVAEVARATLEEGAPITGNLEPLERVVVRARLEGDVVAVLVREGEPVRAGQLLARLEDTEESSAYRSAEAEVAAARTELATAEWNLEQTAELVRAGAVAEREERLARQAVAAARARLAAAEARLRAAAQALADTRVVSPLAGVVESRSVEGGERVARGAPLFTVVRSEVLELEAVVPARRARGVAPGQRVRFTVDGRTFEGRVARVGPTIDPATRSLRVYVQVPNADGAIKGGTFVTGRIVTGVIRDALVVPVSAVHHRPDGGAPFVYVIREGVVDHAPVELGVTDESRGLVQVLAGLTERDRVVVGNVGLLGRGMAVQVIRGESGSGPAPRPGSARR